MSEAVVDPINKPASPGERRGGLLRRALGSDLLYSFRRSRLTMLAGADAEAQPAGLASLPALNAKSAAVKPVAGSAAMSIMIPLMPRL